jgi:hypothetical protein
LGNKLKGEKPNILNIKNTQQKKEFSRQKALFGAHY